MYDSFRKYGVHILSNDNVVYNVSLVTIHINVSREKVLLKMA